VMSMAHDPRGPSNIEPEVFEALWRLYQRGETDLLDGGVPTPRLGRELGRTRKTVYGVLQRLEAQGVVQQLHGAAPENYRPRLSWAPIALLEGGEQR